MTRIIVGVGLALFVASLIITGCNNESEVDAIEPERISLAEFKNLLDSEADIVVVDTRSTLNYDEGHIPGAIPIPYPDEIRSRNEELPRDKMVILYCSWPAENTSAGAARILEEEFGFEHDLLRALKGGFPGWQAAGYPVEKSWGKAINDRTQMTRIWRILADKGGKVSDQWPVIRFC